MVTDPVERRHSLRRRGREEGLTAEPQRTQRSEGERAGLHALRRFASLSYHSPLSATPKNSSLISASSAARRFKPQGRPERVEQAETCSATVAQPSVSQVRERRFACGILSPVRCAAGLRAPILNEMRSREGSESMRGTGYLRPESCFPVSATRDRKS